MSLAAKGGPRRATLTGARGRALLSSGYDVRILSGGMQTYTAFARAADQRAEPKIRDRAGERAGNRTPNLGIKSPTNPRNCS